MYKMLSQFSHVKHFAKSRNGCIKIRESTDFHSGLFAQDTKVFSCTNSLGREQSGFNLGYNNVVYVQGPIELKARKRLLPAPLAVSYAQWPFLAIYTSLLSPAFWRM